jgi:hypothetical protein
MSIRRGGREERKVQTEKVGGEDEEEGVRREER